MYRSEWFPEETRPQLMLHAVQNPPGDRLSAPRKASPSPQEDQARQIMLTDVQIGMVSRGDKTAADAARCSESTRRPSVGSSQGQPQPSGRPSTPNNVDGCTDLNGFQRRQDRS